MRAFVDSLLAQRVVLFVAVLLATVALAAAASRVRPDYSVEALFPAWDPARDAFDRYREQFPGEAARAVVLVEAPGLFSPEGLGRLEQLEKALARLPSVVGTIGPASLWTTRPTALGPTRERYLDPAADPVELERSLAAARRDPLIVWNVLPPEGDAAAILLDLDPAAAGTDAGREAFLERARRLLEREQRQGERLLLSGVPVVKAQITALIARDAAVLVPVAAAIVLLVLLLALRSVGAVLAGAATLGCALIGSMAVPGILGWPATLVTGLLPVIVIVVSVSDTVHLASDYLERLRRGEAPPNALAAATAGAAVPCLVTELVLAVGFLSLAFVGLTAIAQFAVCTAFAMLLTWLANVTVLPLGLGLVTRPPAASRRAHGLFASGVVRWMAQLGDRRPRAVLAGGALILAGALALAARVERRAFAFDDLRAGSPLERALRSAERVHGGLVLSAIHLEVHGAGEAPALDPEAIRLADRAAAFLRTLPGIRHANSLADVLRPVHRTLAGDDPEVLGDGLPDSREGALQELASLAEPRLVGEFLSRDKRSLAVTARALDVGSGRVEALYEQIDAWIAGEQAALAARADGVKLELTATGQMRVFKGVNDLLLGGAVASFAGAVLVSLLAMSLAFKSLRLGLVALVPNVAPVILGAALMGVAGIPLNPVTAMLFSITLVIADDDTIQFLVRFRRRYHALRSDPAAVARASREGSGSLEQRLHRRAALETMEDAGPAMVAAGLATSLGFLVLLFAEFLGPARLGALVAVSLLGALAADLLLSPVLLARFAPLAPRGTTEAAAAAGGEGSGGSDPSVAPE